MVEQPPCKRQVRGSTPLSGSEHMNYLMTTRILFLITISFNALLYILGYLRASILYDYVAYWPLTLLPAALHFFLYRSKVQEYIKVCTILLSTIFFITFPILHILLQPKFLPTYSVATEVNRVNQIEVSELDLRIDTKGSIEISSIEGKGYLLDAINLPGNIGFPEAIEIENVVPKIIVIREIDVDTLLKTKGWKIGLGNKNLWNLDIFSIDSTIHLENVNLNEVVISGTGLIYLDDQNIFDYFAVRGNFTIFVPENLSLLVEGNALVPDRWLEATIGYLSQTNQTYKVKIVVLSDSEVRFEDY